MDLAGSPKDRDRQGASARSRAQSQTVDNLLAAAERLFAERGIEAVSHRQIILMAGANNNSAITYHFGDKESLVAAIWAKRLPELEKIRLEMLMNVVAEGKLDDLESLLRVLFMPAYRLVDDDGRHRYCAFLRHALTWLPGQAIRMKAMTETPTSARTLALVRDLCPHIPEAAFQWRLNVVSRMFFDMIEERDAGILAGQTRQPEEVFFNEAFRLVIACCRA